MARYRVVSTYTVTIEHIHDTKSPNTDLETYMDTDRRRTVIGTHPAYESQRQVAKCTSVTAELIPEED